MAVVDSMPKLTTSIVGQAEIPVRHFRLGSIEDLIEDEAGLWV
jgi:hypothetical protein